MHFVSPHKIEVEFLTPIVPDSNISYDEIANQVKQVIGRRTLDARKYSKIVNNSNFFVYLHQDLRRIQFYCNSFLQGIVQASLTLLLLRASFVNMK